VNKDREGIVFGLMNQDERMKIYHASKNGKVEVFVDYDNNMEVWAHVTPLSNLQNNKAYRIKPEAKPEMEMMKTNMQKYAGEVYSELEYIHNIKRSGHELNDENWTRIAKLMKKIKTEQEAKPEPEMMICDTKCPMEQCKARSGNE
jgi:hypothetical protein